MSELFPRSTSRRRSPRSGFNDREEKPKGDGGLFGWTIFILLLVGLVAVCWMGTIYILGHPEKPIGYSMLHKFKKLEAPKRFNELAAPKGEFLDAKKLYARYSTMAPRQLENESARLLRNYIRNYQGTDGLVPYITGRFVILDSYELKKDDFFQSGVVALAQDSETPQVLIENLFTNDDRMVPTLYRSLLTGVEIPIRRSIDLSPIIHIEKLPDGRLKFTTIPIQYPNYSATQGPGSLAVEPPPSLNVEAGLPILSNAKVADADRHYASFRHKLARPGTDASATPPPNSLLPVRPATTTDGQAAAPTVPRPVAVAPAPSPKPAPMAVMPPVPVAPTPEPRVMPAIPVNAQPTQAVAVAPAVGADVPLKPFMGGAPVAVATTTSGKWPTYKPGQMPRGKLVGVSDARGLAASDVSAQPLYLHGDFNVTAANGSSAVLRSSSSDPTSAGTAGNTRIVVQYPAGSRSPDQGGHVSRGGDRPFLITNIQQKPDGQVNIYVREVTTE
jgi:hypothetical protein